MPRRPEKRWLRSAAGAGVGLRTSCLARPDKPQRQVRNPPITYVPPPQDLTWRAQPVCGPRAVSCKFTRLMPDCCTRPARGRPEPIPISGQVRVVLDGQGLQTGGHLKQFFLDHQFGCNLGEPPTFGGFLAQEIFEISHRISRRLCRCASWSRSGREDRTAGSENPTVTWRITWSSATIARRVAVCCIYKSETLTDRAAACASTIPLPDVRQKPVCGRCRALKRFLFRTKSPCGGCLQEF
jgi:hypothetical protein